MKENFCLYSGQMVHFKEYTVLNSMSTTLMMQTKNTFLIELFWPINPLSGNYIKLSMRINIVLSCTVNNLSRITLLLFASTWFQLYMNKKLFVRISQNISDE